MQYAESNGSDGHDHIWLPADYRRSSDHIDVIVYGACFVILLIILIIVKK